MLTALIIGLVAGLVIAMPPGLAGVGAMRYALFIGIKPGNKFAAANGLMDFVYSFMAVFATSAFATEIIDLAESYPLVTVIIQSLVVSGLIYFGVRSFKQADQPNTKLEAKKQKKKDYLDRFEQKGPFLFGMAIAFMNAANPSFFATLLSLTGYINAHQWIPNTFAGKTIFAVAFGFGNFLWLMILMRLIKKYKSRLSETMMARIQQLAGLSFIGFGTLIGARVLIFTKWGAILKYVIVF
jgi:threonine/homoserine/homoserine lactone efflux protein